MATAGPNLCTASAEYGSGTSWTGIGNATTSDNSYTSCSITGSSFTKPIIFNGFNLSIPQGAVIEGILVDIEKKSLNGTFRNSSIQLVKTGTTVVGSDLNDNATWSTTESTSTTGSVTELWGTTWTPEELNDSQFGVSVTAWQSNAGGSDTASVDSVTISVVYSGGAIPSLLIL